MDNRPIGIFDSGFGGLTVAKEIVRELPNESIVYFGDNGRTPYGTKSKETIVKFTFQNIKFLLEQKIKLLVIACNTASSCSYEAVIQNFSVPVIEVIKPGSVAAVRESKSKKIGVIGTSATIGSGIYEHTMKGIEPSIKVFSKACPMFVPLVEEGWWDNHISYLVAEEYLSELKNKDIDTLLLGCTHYPMLKNIISKVFEDKVSLVSSAFEVASKVKGFLAGNQMTSGRDTQGQHLFFTSDNVEKFANLGSIILEEEISRVEHVNIEKY